MGDSGAAALAAALEKNTSLQELHLNGELRDYSSYMASENHVGDAGAAALAAALEKNTSLHILNLYRKFFRVVFD